MDGQELADLEKVAMDLFGSLSPQEQEAVMKQAAELDNYINNLPEEERRKLEEDLERELKGLMDSGALQGLPQTLKQDTIDQTPIPVNPATETKKEVERPISKDVPDLQKYLKELVEEINDLVLKATSQAKISTDEELELLWIELLPKLEEIKAYLLIIANHPKIADALLSDEYKLLKTQLEDFANHLKAEKKKLLPTTTNKFLNTLNFDSIINFLQKEIETNQLLWNTKRLVQKYAPEEVKAIEAKPMVKVDITKPATGSTIAKTKTDRSYAAEKSFGPKPLTGGVGAMPSYAPKPSSTGSAGSSMGGGNAPVAKKEKPKAPKGGGNAPRSAGAAKTEGGDKEKPKAPKSGSNAPRSAGAGEAPKKQEAKKPAENPAVKEKQNKITEQAKAINKKIKETDVINKMDLYARELAKPVEARTVDVNALYQDITKQLNEIWPLTITLERAAENLNMVADKLPEEARNKAKKEASGALKIKRLPKLIEKIEALTRDEFADLIDKAEHLDAQAKNDYKKLRELVQNTIINTKDQIKNKLSTK